MGKRIIVLGATGLVGRHVVERLASEEAVATVVAVTRRPVTYTSAKVMNEVVDFEHLEAHRDLFRGDALCSCLGTTRRQAGSVSAQRRVDYDYQYMAACLAAENGVEHYLLVSSGGASAQARAAYPRMKGELEDAVAALGFARMSIFRPSLIVGTREDFRLGESIARYLLPVLATIPPLKKYRAIRGDVVADKIVRAALSAGPTRALYQFDEIFAV